VEKARVERTLLSAAFDLDFDLDLALALPLVILGKRSRAKRATPDEGPALSGAEGCR